MRVIWWAWDRCRRTLLPNLSLPMGTHDPWFSLLAGKHQLLRQWDMHGNPSKKREEMSLLRSLQPIILSAFMVSGYWNLLSRATETLYFCSSDRQGDAHESLLTLWGFWLRKVQNLSNKPKIFWAAKLFSGCGFSRKNPIVSLPGHYWQRICPLPHWQLWLYDCLGAQSNALAFVSPRPRPRHLAAGLPNPRLHTRQKPLEWAVLHPDCASLTYDLKVNLS